MGFNSEKPTCEICQEKEATMHLPDERRVCTQCFIDVRNTAYPPGIGGSSGPVVLFLGFLLTFFLGWLGLLIAGVGFAMFASDQRRTITLLLQRIEHLEQERKSHNSPT